MKVKLDKGFDRLQKECKRAGWVLKARSNGNLYFESPDGEKFWLHRTPSDYRAVRNMRARLVRAGLPR